MTEKPRNLIPDLEERLEIFKEFNFFFEDEYEKFVHSLKQLDLEVLSKDVFLEIISNPQRFGYNFSFAGNINTSLILLLNGIFKVSGYSRPEIKITDISNFLWFGNLKEVRLYVDEHNSSMQKIISISMYIVRNLKKEPFLTRYTRNNLTGVLSMEKVYEVIQPVVFSFIRQMAYIGGTDIPSVILENPSYYNVVSESIIEELRLGILLLILHYYDESTGVLTLPERYQFKNGEIWLNDKSGIPGGQHKELIVGKGSTGCPFGLKVRRTGKMVEDEL